MPETCNMQTKTRVLLSTLLMTSCVLIGTNYGVMALGTGRKLRFGDRLVPLTAKETNRRRKDRRTHTPAVKRKRKDERRRDVVLDDGIRSILASLDERPLPAVTSKSRNRSYREREGSRVIKKVVKGRRPTISRVNDEDIVTSQQRNGKYESSKPQRVAWPGTDRFLTSRPRTHRARHAVTSRPKTRAYRGRSTVTSRPQTGTYQARNTATSRPRNGAYRAGNAVTSRPQTGPYRARNTGTSLPRNEAHRAGNAQTSRPQTGTYRAKNTVTSRPQNGAYRAGNAVTSRPQTGTYRARNTVTSLPRNEAHRAGKAQTSRPQTGTYRARNTVTSRPQNGAYRAGNSVTSRSQTGTYRARNTVTSIAPAQSKDFSSSAQADENNKPFKFAYQTVDEDGRMMVSEERRQDDDGLQTGSYAVYMGDDVNGEGVYRIVQWKADPTDGYSVTATSLARRTDEIAGNSATYL